MEIPAAIICQGWILLAEASKAAASLPSDGGVTHPGDDYSESNVACKPGPPPPGGGGKDASGSKEKAGSDSSDTESEESSSDEKLNKKPAAKLPPGEVTQHKGMGAGEKKKKRGGTRMNRPLKGGVKKLKMDKKGTHHPPSKEGSVSNSPEEVMGGGEEFSHDITSNDGDVEAGMGVARAGGEVSDKREVQVPPSSGMEGGIPRILRSFVQAVQRGFTPEAIAKHRSEPPCFQWSFFLATQAIDASCP